ncbi:MAG: tRNA (N6-isopentenyl adenosine(37)-C2)-methylthiotransferase MiaB [Spirochaetes bacterium]|jgi:tRNA-2-methylthio-N6-dimethylallyladenosine synthase|nr:tRNA (N6-isopentenyl adenosine(37)-C2)-methylthiotransferase MiaB [Spirochaetota bacterium]
MKKFYIETFGCQMNKDDSELIRYSMLMNGFEETSSEDEADICIFNTCSVREHAENRALSRIKIAGNKKTHPKTIVVAGCMAQRLGQRLIDDKLADIVTGPYQAPDLGAIVAQKLQSQNPGVFLSQEISDFKERLNLSMIRHSETNWHKWVTITHGCENFCAYCIVPYVRGKLISFPSEKIIQYIKELATRGVIEITLLGQNVNQYGQDCSEIPFYKLLEKAAEIDGIKKVNFLTSHPMDFEPEIIEVIKEHDNISKSIHLPLQSGSDSILKAMNRKYSIKDYFKIIETINKNLRDFSISTDLIVGFPGETEEDYKNTLDAVMKIRFDEAFMYAYSPREGTPASMLKETLSREEKIERLKKLISIQRNISLEKLKARINKIEYVIGEKISKKSSQEITGKTFLNHPVVFKGSYDDIGKVISVNILSVKGTTLVGEKIN